MGIIDIKTMMNLDREKLAEKPTSTVTAKKLSELTGEEQQVKVQALSGGRYLKYLGPAQKTEDYEKMYDAQAIVVGEAVVDPDLKDKGLQEHFGVKNSRDLAKVLFPGGELTEIFQEVSVLSGYLNRSEIEPEDEIKN